LDLKKIEEGARLIIEGIGEDVNRKGLIDTPKRIAKMYSDVFSGIGKDPKEVVGDLFEEDHDEMILIKDIPFFSFCEHHLMPFIGKTNIAYIPNESGKIVGLSKLARVVDVASQKPQVQERLTTEIADAINDTLKPRGVLVVIEAEHFCMSLRGIKKRGSITVTSAVRGLFRTNASTRAEAMSLLIEK